MGGQPRVVGRYELREVVGTGGFATVYRAYDPYLRREVALKVLDPHLARNTVVRQRFLREGQALASVRHANVVQIYDAGEAEGTAYLAMELVEGPALSAILAERGPLPLTEVLELTDQVAGALTAVHARNLIHRDVKPANILVEQGSGRAVLLDLGIARALDGLALTAPGALVGTPRSLAPEQLQPGGQVTPLTDVYQLGTTVYTLLAGRPPFEGDEIQLLNAIASQAPPDLGDLRPDLPPGVVAVVAEAMAKNPARRPAGTREFAAQLRAAAGPRPAAPPTSTPTVQRPAAGAGGERRPAGDAPAPSVPPTVAQPAAPQTVAASPPGSPPTWVAASPSPQPAPPARTLTPQSAPTQHAARRRAPVRSMPSRARTIGIALAVAVAVLALAAVVLTRALSGGGGDETQTPARTAVDSRDTATAAPAPLVSDLKVYDNATDRHEREFVAGDSIAACLTLNPGRDGRPLVIVAADRSDPPRDANDPSVVARSDPVPQRAGSECYTVRVLKPPLPPGTYWMSVLHGGDRLESASFVARARPGDTLLHDDFEDPARGKLPGASDEPSRYRRGYDGGEYVIRKLDPQWNGVPLAPLPGSYENAALIVEVRLVGESMGRFIALACRVNEAGHYRLTVGPGGGSFVLSRWEGGREIVLVQPQPSAALRRGAETNRLELSCAGDTIAATINGTEVAVAHDTTFRTGGMWIGVEETPNNPPVTEARFAGLTVVQR